MEKVVKLTNGTTGGPVFVYVKDDRIVRITPIEFDEGDAASWTIKARGRTFSPPRHATVSPWSVAMRSTIYAPNRLLYPLKRVDFDPHGRRNCEKRGISGYERISWDEATDIVTDEIKANQTRIWSGCHHEHTRIPPHVGKCWLSPQHLAQIHEPHGIYLCRP